ncbi:MAG: methyltransferase [Alphaproteobacteria bacterium]|nr:MAG: methyltransferase [Alphaproteobacteria bacterium]
MSLALNTLLYQIQNGSFHFGGGRVIFLNAMFHSDLSVLSDSDLTVQQHFKPYENALVQAGFTVQPDIPCDDGTYDMVCLLVPKNMVEARYFMARGLRLLRHGGALICAADNKAGGTRLKKMMHNFGVQDLCDDARNKARAVWGVVNDAREDEIEKALSVGAVQDILDGEYTSQAGVFGWDKVDKGSALLTQHIPQGLKGKGADFGCGYGYLSKFLLSHCPKIKQMHCIDADYRAVELCRKNLAYFNQEQQCVWRDLTQYDGGLKNLDFVVMNPPFHEGKKADLLIGQNFIETAYQSLRRGGRLWMVANNHLSYEHVLNRTFLACDKVYEGQGFKILSAQKLK